MTFDEWWLKLKPAECDELKEVFRECWYTAKDDGDSRGYKDGFADGIKEASERLDK